MSTTSEHKDCDDQPCLSTETYAALQEFYRNNDLKNCCQIAHVGGVVIPDENWQLSQFWYDDVTSRLLSEEALAVVGTQGRIACVSCPSIFTELRKVSPHHLRRSCCFEYDQRFEVFFGENFIFYDYKEPLNLPKELQNSFDLVILDPPFLSRECLEKCSQTAKFLMKEKIILCTGSIMEELALELLHVTKCNFIPVHRNNLANEFCCYTNYKTMVLDQN